MRYIHKRRTHSQLSASDPLIFAKQPMAKLHFYLTNGIYPTSTLLFVQIQLSFQMRSSIRHNRTGPLFGPGPCLCRGSVCFQYLPRALNFLMFLFSGFFLISAQYSSKTSSSISTSVLYNASFPSFLQPDIQYSSPLSVS